MPAKSSRVSTTGVLAQVEEALRLRDKGLTSEAIGIIKRAAEDHPASHRAWNELWQILADYYLPEQYDDYLKNCCRRAVDTSPDKRQKKLEMADYFFSAYKRRIDYLYSRYAKNYDFEGFKDRVKNLYSSIDKYQYINREQRDELLRDIKRDIIALKEEKENMGSAANLDWVPWTVAGCMVLMALVLLLIFWQDAQTVFDQMVNDILKAITQTK